MIKKLLLTSILLLTSTAFALNNGEMAPDFSLKTFDGKTVNLSDYKDKTVVLEWTNPGCPFVKKHYEKGHMQALQKKYREQGVVWLTINSTNKDHKDFLTKDKASEVAKKWSVDSNYTLEDTDGKVGRMYSAKTTPHIFVLDKGAIAYQGAIDSDSDVFADPAKADNWASISLDKLAKGEKIETSKTSPYGCGVKYQ